MDFPPSTYLNDERQSEGGTLAFIVLNITITTPLLQGKIY